MEPEKIKSLTDFFNKIDETTDLGNEINLFRGQSENKSLLPSIVRDNPNKDTTDLEKEMLEDLKRRSGLIVNKEMKNDWEWLIFAQHYGLKTRLLDWTSNPLVALWFACSQTHFAHQNSFVYILRSESENLVNLSENPFDIKFTRILRPQLNNERIIAQSGWFTAHRYFPKANKFVGLEHNDKLKNGLAILEIPANIKNDILKKLSIYGINHRTLYPDITGLCSHLNWKYLNKKAANKL